MKWHFVCDCGHEFSRTTPCRKDLTRWECPTSKDRSQPRFAGTLPEKLSAMRKHRISPAMFSWEVDGYKTARARVLAETR